MGLWRLSGFFVCKGNVLIKIRWNTNTFQRFDKSFYSVEMLTCVSVSRLRTKEEEEENVPLLLVEYIVPSSFLLLIVKDWALSKRCKFCSDVYFKGGHGQFPGFY